MKYFFIFDAVRFTDKKSTLSSFGGKLFSGFLILFFLCVNFSFSQQFNFITYSTDDGLPQSTVYDIFQDKQGFLWLGTDGGGLTRYDGFRFKSYDKSYGLDGNVVKRIVQDENGLIWIATTEGLYYLKNEKIYSFDQIEENKSTSFTSVFLDSKKNLWASSSGKGVFKITGPEGKFKLKRYTTSEGLSGDFIFDVCEDKQGMIWFASFGNGLDVLDAATDKIRLIKQEDDTKNDVISLRSGVNGSIVFGTRTGAFILNLKESEPAAKIIPGTEGNQVWSIIEDKSGNFWVATNRNGIVCSNNSLNLGQKNGLATNTTYKIFVDREDNTWIGTGDAGVIKFLGSRFTHITSNELSGISQVSAICRDNQNIFWLGSANGLYSFQYINNLIVPKNYFSSKNGLSGNEVTGLVLDRQKGLWISTRNGVTYYDGSKFKTYSESNGLGSNNTNCILADSKGRVWIGTAGGLSLLNEQKEFSNVSETNGLVNNEVQCLYEDKKGNIWVGTLGGLVKFDGEKLYAFNEEDGLIEKKIYSLAEDINGNIYIGTFGGGIYRFDPLSKSKKSIQKLITNENLSSENIYSLTFENDHTLIVATNKGLSKIIFSADFSVRSLKNLGRLDGFKNPENSLNASLKHGREIFFGTTKGVTIYHVDADKINGVKPILEITDFKVNGTTQNNNRDNKLSSDQNSVKINFVAVSLTNSSKNLYFAKLAGLDTSWNRILIDKDSPEAFGFVEYKKLNPGQYELFLKAKNNDGIESEIKSIKFFIAQPFYKTKLFIISSIVIFVLLVYFFFKFRERTLLKEKEKLERIVTERTAEVVESKQEIEAQKNLLEIQKHEITDSINYSKRIQNAILPEQDQLFGRFSQSFILYQPKDIVSGDFYFFSEAEKGFFLGVADCTGHGVPGAFMSMIGSKELSEAVKTNNQPGAILSALNVGMRKTLKQSNMEIGIKDGMDICFLKIDDSNKNGDLLVSYSGANRPLWIVKSVTKEIVEIKATKTAIGGYTPDEQVFEQHEVEIQKGDSIYLFSDGYADQFGGNSGKKMMTKRFKELLIEAIGMSMPEQQKYLNDYFNSWKGNVNEQVDDVCVIGIRA